MTKQFCTFHLGDHYYGLDVLRVQEVVRNQPLTRVPLAPGAVRGLINLRGQIVTAIDLRARLELPPADDESSDAVSVIVQMEDGAVSFAVDQIGDVLELPDEQFESPPETLRGSVRALILGSYKLPETLLVVLDPERIVAAV
ncbi:MAG: chemotaxis protein CheW [Pirellulales bacterium]